MSTPGAFIVIDGTDGSGKATQTRLLIDRMKQEDIPVETIAFPQYGRKSCGPVERYLAGHYGEAKDIGPKRASILFAVDRFDAAGVIRDHLARGVNVIADRYVGSNMGHQGSHIQDDDERLSFYHWNLELEYDIFALPRPTVNLVLHVPAETAFSLVKQRAKPKGDTEEDILESDLNHLRAAERAYLDLTERFDDFERITCTEEDTLLSPEIIHDRIWSRIAPHLSRPRS